MGTPNQIVRAALNEHGGQVGRSRATGQIIASDVVRQLAAGKDFLFADLGETELRGFEDPVKLWEVRWQEVVS